MIIEVDKGIGPGELSAIRHAIQEEGYSCNVDHGEEVTVIGVRGKFISEKLEDRVRRLPGVLNIFRITEPDKEVLRRFHPSDTVITLANGTKIGGDNFTLMVGTCAVEDYQTVLEAAHWAKDAGAQVLRGGAFKPRTGPYSFQGLKEKGLEILARVKEETGLPIVTEILIPEDESMSLKQLIEMFERYSVDIYQVGARSAQTFGLVHALSKINHPVLYKNGLGMTAEEFLQGAEYLLTGAWGPDNHNGAGNPNVMLCVRGISLETTVSRFPLDAAWIPYLRRKSHLPVIADPSHSAGKWWLVADQSLALIAAGAHGLEIEVHPNPKVARSDDKQAIGLEQLLTIARVGREIFEARKSIPVDYRMTPHYVDGIAPAPKAAAPAPQQTI